MTALIAAAGRGERFGSCRSKLLSPLAGKPIIAHTVEVFERCDAVRDIVIVAGVDQLDIFECLTDNHGWSKISAVTAGGEHRQDSVANGLACVRQDAELVAIHDGARPLITEDVIMATAETAKKHGAAIAAVPVVDTLKIADEGGFVSETPDRNRFFAVQTPQIFRRELIVEAYRRAREANLQATDDAALVEAMGHSVKMVMGSHENIKITTANDLAIAEAVMEARGCASDDRPIQVRIGYGYDIHAFGEGRKLFLGGVEFPGETGLMGYSDADVVIHAVCDALLGAAGIGDIGRLYPNTDPRYAGIRSVDLLEDVGKRLAEAGWRVSNVDAMLVAEKPRIADRVSEMRRAMAAALGVNCEDISVKSTTSEGLGALGREEGIACTAVAMIGSFRK